MRICAFSPASGHDTERLSFGLPPKMPRGAMHWHNQPYHMYHQRNGLCHQKTLLYRRILVSGTGGTLKSTKNLITTNIWNVMKILCHVVPVYHHPGSWLAYHTGDKCLLSGERRVQHLPVAYTPPSPRTRGGACRPIACVPLHGVQPIACWHSPPYRVTTTMLAGRLRT